MTTHRERNAFRIVGGDVLTLDPEVGHLRGHDVHVADDGTIAAVEPTRESDPIRPGDIDARRMLVAPGFIDVHRHLWVSAFRGVTADQTAQGYRQYTKSVIAPVIEPDDIYAATLHGRLEALDAGITTLVDYAHIMKAPEYADATIAALRAAGARTVLAHAPPNGDDNSAWWSASERRHPDDLGRVCAALGEDRLLTAMMGGRGVHFLAPGTLERDVDFARELGVPVMFEGIGAAIGGAGRWSLDSHRTALVLDRSGRLGPDLIFVHGNQLPGDELDLIGRSGGHLAVAPLTEMLCGYGTPAYARAREAGLRPGLAVDIVTSAGGDMFGPMRALLAAERGQQADRAYRSGAELPGWDLTTTDVLAAATTDGARLLGQEARLGSVAPGRWADLILVRRDDLNLAAVADPAAALALHAHAGNIDTVIVAGQVRKRGGTILGSEVDQANALLHESRRRLEATAGGSGDVAAADRIWRF